MKQTPLNQARGCLRLAERAFEALCRAGGDRTEFQIHWGDYLVQWKRTYTRIQQAAKDTPAELQWFGAVNRERRGDPLLRWLYEARNDGEHGTNLSALHSSGALEFTSHGSQIAILMNGDGTPFIGSDGRPLVLDDGKKVDVVSVEPAFSELVEVTEYDGKKKVPPPTSHLGEPMEPKPHLAADLGLRWLKKLVETAVAMSAP